MSGNRRGPKRPRRNVQQESEVDPNANLWAQMMQSTQQHREMMQMFQQQMQHQQGQRGNHAFKEFCRMNPPMFEGDYVPVVAREWIHQIEGSLEAIECPEAEKVTFATRFFRGAACDWWEGARAHMNANQVERNWANFKCLLIAHYVPDSFQFEMKQELSELKQGSMSVAEYTRKFNELVRYASEGADTPSESWKMKKYIFGLRADIAHDVSMQPIANFGDLIHRSFQSEAGLQHIRRKKGRLFKEEKIPGSSIWN